jgi:hypothetical protein
MKKLIAAGEGSARVLTVAKLVNAALTMLWGFAVTFVFVRALPVNEFRAFLLLVAFNNFTISAEFGMTHLIYARMRRHWLGREQERAENAADDFRPEEIGVLFLFLAALILCAGVLVGLAIVLGWIDTAFPAVFLLFFFASALNVMLLLAKRALAALDHNLLWEMLDIGRRLINLGILFSVLAGVSLLTSVVVQFSLNLVFACLGMALIHRRAGMALHQWFALRVGGDHVRRSYVRDISASVGLTASEITAYNGPYFVIAAISHDPALLIIFDFTFKMIRAVSTTIRATIEGALPRLTRNWFAGEHAAFRSALARAVLVAIVVALCADSVLLAIGGRLFATLYHDADHLWIRETWLLCLLFPSLAVVCVSVYIQGALGRFRHLLKLSLPFLAGALLVPAGAAMLSPGADRLVFMPLYALLFSAVAMMHWMSLARLKASA